MYTIKRWKQESQMLLQVQVTIFTYAEKEATAKF